MHGANGGPKTKQGLRVCKKASFKHGFYSKESLEELHFIQRLAKKEKIFYKQNKQYNESI